MLIDTARLLLRRWLLVVLALVVSVGAGVVAVVVTPPTYQSRAQVLFLPPTSQPGIDGKVNPFLALGAALGVTADIVRLDVSDDTTRAELVARGAIENYEVVPYLAENGGPILIVTAEGRRAQQTRDTVNQVVEVISRDLRSLQASADAPSGSFITATPLTETPKPERLYKNQIRSAALAAPGALVLLLALIVVGDRMASARARRRDVAHRGAEGHARPTAAPSGSAGRENPGRRPGTAQSSTSRELGKDKARAGAGRS
ncbi:MAG: hypothetical protein IE926_03580 [Micrococcales bacterium]|nr:hypothetical protein [Micrococcales bacterium]